MVADARVDRKEQDMAIEKLRNGKWSEDIATAKEFNAKVNEIKAAVKEHGFEGKTIRPYSYRTTVGEFIDGWQDFARCSFPSKRVIISEVNGLIDLINIWTSRA